VNALIKEIQILERDASVLDPNSEERQSLLKKMNAYTEEFLVSLEKRRAYVETDDKGSDLYKSPIAEGGLDIDTVLQQFKYNVDRPGLNAASGGHMAYIPGSSMYASALGDYLAAIVNRFSGDFATCPGAVRMENQVVRWISDLVGYPTGAAGNLTSGGSLATLSAIVAARESYNLRSKDFTRAVVYATEDTHHCADKALQVAGMGECVIRRVPIDATHHMIPDELEHAISEDNKNGLIPWVAIGSAGTTNLGSVDDLRALYEIAKANNLWYHVDAAYGGFFLLSDIVKDKLDGIEASDSVVLDPHKGMFLPFGTGAIIVRDGKKLYKAHYHTADYLQDSLTGQEELSPADLGPELSRHFRAVRLWLPLKLTGISPFRSALSEKILLARYTYERLSKMDGFELGPYPDLSIFVFRYVPTTGNADEFNRKLLKELRHDGRFFLSSTLIERKFVIRVAVLSMRTHLETIDNFLALLEKMVYELSQT
jgi:aromatic-L-amino-acid/L-tryptophan decarboxylase